MSEEIIIIMLLTMTVCLLLEVWLIAFIIYIKAFGVGKQ